MNKIFVIGVGPGHPDYLLPVALKQIRRADRLIGTAKTLALFRRLKKEEFPFDGRLATIIPTIKKYRKTKKIALLVSGDPGFHSILQAVSKAFKKDEYEVIPGIGSLPLAFARIGECWQGTKIISLHGKKINASVLKDLRRQANAFILTDRDFPPEKLAAYLLKQGFENRRAVVLENLSAPDERIIDTRLNRLSHMKGFGLCVIILKKQE